MKKIIFYLMLIVNTFHFACSQNKEQVIIEQVYSSYPVILKSNSKKDAISFVKFYPTFDISNRSKEKISLSYTDYIYKGNFSKDRYKGSGTATPMFFYKDGILINVLENETIGQLQQNKKQYIVSTSHRISRDSLIQSMFIPYLDRMKAENKDTLHIGTISELKEKKSPILKALEGDSIIISFDKEDVYFDPIPVQIK